MESPIKSSSKGLEKLLSELKLERQKCTKALEERSKYKIEIEKLKLINNEIENELKSIEIYNKNLLDNFNLSEKKINELEVNLLSKDEELNQVRNKYTKLENEYKRVTISYNNETNQQTNNL